MMALFNASIWFELIHEGHKKNTKNGLFFVFFRVLRGWNN